MAFPSFLKYLTHTFIQLRKRTKKQLVALSLEMLKPVQRRKKTCLLFFRKTLAKRKWISGPHFIECHRQAETKEINITLVCDMTFYLKQDKTSH